MTSTPPLREPYYVDEFVTLYLGDAREVEEWRQAAVVVTDPPYGIAWSRGENTNRWSKAHAGIIGDEDTSVRDDVLACVPLTVPRAVFGSFYAPFPVDVRQVLVWEKPLDAGVVGSATGYRRDAEPIFLCGDWPQRKVHTSSVLRSRRLSIKSICVETGHPHTKPIDVLQTLIANGPDGIVADPFCGSGSTLVAAKRLGRRAIGVEVSEAYCEVAARRLAPGVLVYE